MTQNPGQYNPWANRGGYGGYPQMIVDLVSGEQEARAFSVPYGATAFLFDREKPIFYQKAVSADGRSGSFKIFDYQEHPAPEAFDPSKFASKADFLQLQQAIAELRTMMKGGANHNGESGISVDAAVENA